LLSDVTSVILKIDAEGSEPEILRGLDRVLQSAESVAVIVEWNRKFSSPGWFDRLRERFRVREIVPSAVEPGYGLEEIRRWEQLRGVLVSNLLLTSGPRWDQGLRDGGALAAAPVPADPPVQASSRDTPTVRPYADPISTGEHGRKPASPSGSGQSR